MELIKPFRWDVTKKNQLGSLIEGECAESYSAFEKDLIRCCARIIAFSNDSDLFFIGRSPESIFDKLSGLLERTKWEKRLYLAHFSMRIIDEYKEGEEFKRHLKHLRAYFKYIGLDPFTLHKSGNRTALVDLVSSGRTFENLIELLYDWSIDDKVNWNEASRKIRVVGITERTSTSPNKFRWQQHSNITNFLKRTYIKNISIPPRMWRYLANTQLKVSRSYPPWRWGDIEIDKPRHDKQTLEALRLAYKLYKNGTEREQKKYFANHLNKQVALKHRWFRQLINELDKNLS